MDLDERMHILQVNIESLHSNIEQLGGGYSGD